MCTLILLYRFLPAFPILAVHNRYAPIGSVEEPPKASRAVVEFYHPTDSHSRGTWIGLNEKGLFASVTDQYTNGKPTAYRSRGLLLVDVLTSFSKASEALSYVRKELSKGYKKGNFVVADSVEAYHVLHDEKLEVEQLGPGVHVITSLTLRDWVKTEETPSDYLKYSEMRRSRAFELASNLKAPDIIRLIPKLKAIASDHGAERGRGSICYHGGTDWYMSSSTIMAIGDNLEDSQILYCRGNPCENQFADYNHILFDAPTVEISRKSEKLSNKRIALCVTGSVASIEAPKLARELRRHGAEVTCYMTQAGVDYGINPYVMEWATSKPVVLKLTGMTEHLPSYDLVVVYPATLNTVNKIGSGVADNAVTTLCASTGPTRLLIAPAMNLKLYSSNILRDNIERLKKQGVTFVEPVISEGAAKAATIETTTDHVIRCLSISRLRGRGVLILTGPTNYDLDPVRYISNKSTGRLGYCLAKEGFHRGCVVKVVYGPGSVTFPSHIPTMNVYTVEDMLRETLKDLKKGVYEVAIFSAAVLDFKPTTYSEEKIESGHRLRVEFEPTPKIIDEISSRYPDLAIVGFKLEYKISKEELLKRAREELVRTKALMVVANDLSEISENRHRAHLVTKGGDVRDFDGTKMELAHEIFNLIEEALF